MPVNIWEGSILLKYMMNDQQYTFHINLVDVEFWMHLDRDDCGESKEFEQKDKH